MEFAASACRCRAVLLAPQEERGEQFVDERVCPKSWQNLRATRATKLANTEKAHVAAAWPGHSTIVANKHYWQVTDDDFAKAAEGGAESDAASAFRGLQRVARDRLSARKKPRFCITSALHGDKVQNGVVGDTGLEPVAQNAENASSSEKSDAESDVSGARNGAIDPGLALIIERWPNLPEAVRQQIVRLVEGDAT